MHCALLVGHTAQRNHILPPPPPHQKKQAEMCNIVPALPSGQVSLFLWGFRVGQTKISWHSLVTVWYSREFSGLRLGVVHFYNNPSNRYQWSSQYSKYATQDILCAASYPLLMY